MSPDNREPGREAPARRGVLRRTLAVLPFATLALLFAGYLAERGAVRPEDALRLPPVPPGEPEAPPLPPSGPRRTGTVVDSDGAPVADALVWLAVENEPRWDYSGPGGDFALAEVPSGRARGIVVALDREPRRFELELGEEATPLRLEAGPRYGPPPSLPPVERADLAGRLAVDAELDLAGYEVVLEPLAEPLDLSAAVPRRALAAADGAFAFEGLAHGDYAVRVLPAWARDGTWPDLAAQQDGPPVWRHGTDEGVLAVPLAVGALRARVRDPAGEPVEGASALLTPADDESRLWPPFTSDAAGALALDALPPGRYRLAVRAGGGSVAVEVDVEAGRTARPELPPLDPRRAP